MSIHPLTHNSSVCELHFSVCVEVLKSSLVISDFANFTVEPRPCVFVCVSFTSDSSETVEVISIKFGTVPASGMGMHHVLIILTMTFIQGHTDHNEENNKCLIISETIQAMPIKFAVKIV